MIYQFKQNYLKKMNVKVNFCNYKKAKKIVGKVTN